MFCQKKKPAQELKNWQARCRDEAARYDLPLAAAEFFLLHPSVGEGFDVVLRRAVRSPLPGCQVTSWPRDRFSRYLKKVN
jgi:hypothetical protein